MDLNKLVDDGDGTATYYKFYTFNNDLYLLGDTDVQTEQKLSSHFIVTAKFKTNDKTHKWCLFSIKKANKLVFNLCLANAAVGQTRAILQNGDDVFYGMYGGDFTNMTEISVIVKGKSAKFGVNCVFEEGFYENKENKLFQTTLTKDMYLTMATSTGNKAGNFSVSPVWYFIQQCAVIQVMYWFTI